MPWTDPDSVHVPAAGQVAPAAWGLVVNEDLNFLGNPPRCVTRGSVAQSVANNTLTAMAADQEPSDTDGMHSTVTNNTRITAQTAGDFNLTAMANFASDIDGRRAALFRHTAFSGGATTDYNLPGVMAVTTGNSQALGGSRTIEMAVGDYVEFFVIHSAGAALNVTLEEFSARLVGL